MSADVDNVDVLIVADLDDQHGDAVAHALRTDNYTVVRVNLGDLRNIHSQARPGNWQLHIDQRLWEISPATTVWWRREGHIPTEGLNPEEANLAADEGPHILVGALYAARVRWVDDPLAIRRAEHKQYQLAVADNLNVSIPDTVVTNDHDVARALADKHGDVVAKPLSAGFGIAPYTAQPTNQQLQHVESLPTLLQETIDATADLRVVVIGGQAWTWQRPREPGCVDWRQQDRRGEGFSYTTDEHVETDAKRITVALGLTTSVQDWLLTDDGPVFLEANPQGAWLFLDSARQQVTPAFAQHLTRPEAISGGRWPKAWRRFLNDFYPKNQAPDNDGVIAPTQTEPVWAEAVADIPDALETARRAHEEAKSTAATAEEKANRLTQLLLASLTLCIGLAGYHVNLIINGGWLWWLTTLPVVAAFLLLTLSIIEASQIDQVGMYLNPKLDALVGTGTRDPQAVLLAHEEMGRELARWTAKNKISDLMQARAWFTRGLTALFVAGVVVVAVRAATPQVADPADGVPTSAPTVGVEVRPR